MNAAAQPLEAKTAAGAITIRNLDSLLDQIAKLESQLIPDLNA